MNRFPPKRRGRPPKDVSVYDADFFEKATLKGPKKHSERRVALNWELVGCFDSMDEALIIARQNKVSKRKLDELHSGKKITFRCNSWKKTRCGFQMYTLSQNDGKHFLYKGGEHDHTGLRVPFIPTLQAPSAQDFEQLEQALNEPKQEQVDFDTTMDDSCDFEATEEIKFSDQLNGVEQSEDDGFNATDMFNTEANSSFDATSLLDPSNSISESSRVSQKATNQGPYQLQTKIGDFLKIASEYQLQFSFNYGEITEFIVSNQDRKRTVLIRDLGMEVSAEIKVANAVIGRQFFAKCDWTTLSWSIKGLCLHYLVVQLSRK